MAVTTASTDGDRQRGSVSIWLATASLVMIILVGLAVDLGGQVHTQQRARDIAAQAARVGGEQVLAGPAIRGQGVQVDAGAAKSAARDYLAAAGVSGSATIQGGGHAGGHHHRHVPDHLPGHHRLNRLTVTGHASARIIRAVDGVAR